MNNMKKHLSFAPDYIPKNPENHFRTIANRLLTDEIEQQRISDDPEHELKPFTIRLPAYQLSAIDANADVAEMSRQEFMNHLFESAFGSVVVGFASGLFPSSDDLSAFESFMAHTNFNTSKAAYSFIQNTGEASLGMEFISMDNALQKMGVKND